MPKQVCQMIERQYNPFPGRRHCRLGGLFPRIGTIGTLDDRSQISGGHSQNESYRAAFDICRNSEDIFLEYNVRFLGRRNILWERSSEVHSTVVTLK